MANDEALNTLRTVVEQFRKLDIPKVLREELGTGSLKAALGPMLEKLDPQLDFLLTHAPAVPSASAIAVSNHLSTLRQQLEQHAQRNDSEYIAQRENILSNVVAQMDGIQTQRPQFLAAALEAEGYFDVGGTSAQAKELLSGLEKRIGEALAEVDEKTSTAVTQAEGLAKRIEGRAREAAAKISVKEAQQQFAAATTALGGKVRFWGWGTFASFAVFIAVLAWFVSMAPPDGLAVIYFTTIRLALLGVIGAVTALCVRMLRASLHLREVNDHRGRLANSMAAFVEAAATEEQRDVILAQLVDAVASFGVSGYLDGSDQPAQRMTVDYLARTLPGAHE